MNKHLSYAFPQSHVAWVQSGGVPPQGSSCSWEEAGSFLLLLKLSLGFQPQQHNTTFPLLSELQRKVLSCQECLVACFVSHTRVEKKTKIIPSLLLWNKVSDGRGTRAASLLSEGTPAPGGAGLSWLKGGNLQQGPSRVPFWELTDWADKEPPLSAGSQNMLPDTHCSPLGWRDGVQTGLARLHCVRTDPEPCRKSYSFCYSLKPVSPSPGSPQPPEIGKGWIASRQIFFSITSEK